MELQNTPETRKQSVKNLATYMGYSVQDTGDRLNLSLNLQPIFAYMSVENKLYTYSTDYYKELDGRFIAYIRTCLKNNLPPHKQKKDLSCRYVVEKRRTLYAVYDTLTNSKVDTFFGYNQAWRAANDLNDQWSESIQLKGYKNETR